jgi:mono/diheme cytochrome c family protein
MLRQMLISTVLATGFGVATIAAQDAKVQQGQKVYTDQKCSICHSIGGRRNAKGPLDDAGAKLSADAIRQWTA